MRIARDGDGLAASVLDDGDHLSGVRLFGRELPDRDVGPSRAKAMAAARPMPESPPVSSALRSRRRPVRGLLPGARARHAARRRSSSAAGWVALPTPRPGRSNKVVAIEIACWAPFVTSTSSALTRVPRATSRAAIAARSRA